MKGYWHVCTDGLEKGLIFKDKDDFIFGMNGVPRIRMILFSG